MGYITNYKLKVQNLKKETQEKKISIEDVEKKIKNGSSQAEILELLKLLKQGQKTKVVTPKMIIEELREFSEGANYSLNEEGNTKEGSKWYDYDEEFLEFSKKYPDWLFILSGEGEESGDIWNTYYVNGKKQEAKARIVIDDFDASKLR